MLAFPKPAKPERGTARAKAHMERVAQLPCVICGAWPVVVHHVIHDRGAQRRASDLETVPLCSRHHDYTSPEGLHAAPRRWRDLHGPDHGFLGRVVEMLREQEERTI